MLLFISCLSYCWRLYVSIIVAIMIFLRCWIPFSCQKNILIGRNRVNDNQMQSLGVWQFSQHNWQSWALRTRLPCREFPWTSFLGWKIRFPSNFMVNFAKKRESENLIFNFLSTGHSLPRLAFRESCNTNCVQQVRWNYHKDFLQKITKHTLIK